MDQKFYVSDKGQSRGPYSVPEIIDRLSSGATHWMDYVYCDIKKDWTLMMEHEVFMPFFQKGIGLKGRKSLIADPYAMAVKTDQSSFEEQLREKAWYLLKDGSNHGPFAKLDIVQMLQKKSAFEYDFVWKAGFAQWKKICEVQEFSVDAIKQLKQSAEFEISEVFFRRRHERAQYNCSLIVHNNKTVYKGKALEIGAGGAGIVLEEGAFSSGQQIFLHFQPGEGVPPFNAVCKVVNQHSYKDPVTQKNLTKYGVMFTSISAGVRESIKSYAAHQQKQAA